MRHHEARVGKDREHGVEEERVGRRLEVPARRRAARLEQLEHALHEAVGGHHVAGQPPAHVVRQEGHAFEVEGAKAHAEQVLVLGRARRRVLVQGRQPRRERADRVEPLRSGLDARIAVLGRALGRRHRLRRLPDAQRARARILREQVRERGAARARQPHHEDRRGHFLRLDLGVAREPVLDAQALREVRKDAAAPDHAAEVVELRPREVAEQHVEPLAEARVAEVREAACARALRRAGRPRASAASIRRSPSRRRR